MNDKEDTSAVRQVSSYSLVSLINLDRQIWLISQNLSPPVTSVRKAKLVLPDSIELIADLLYKLLYFFCKTLLYNL
jgi:hypothetical protein